MSQLAAPLSDAPQIATEVDVQSSGPAGWAELGLVPDALVRAAIRARCNARHRMLHPRDPERRARLIAGFVEHMRSAPIALVPEKANEQHYEVPAALFEAMLGPHLKYSCCHFAPGVTDLGEAEADALRITTERAELADGQRILELGCGWGSLTLWMAERFPNARITGVSNSASQREHILRRAGDRGLTNVEIVTADANDFAPAEAGFDRVVSVEMFEHLRNWPRMLERVSTWLVPGGKLFLHVFCHRDAPYAYEASGPNDWMSRYFFSGGMMPSAELLLHFQDHLQLEERWLWSGVHYEKTSNAWLANMDRRKAEIMPLLAQTYGETEARRWFGRWRLFYLACAELFGLAGGDRWMVGHYRMTAR